LAQASLAAMAPRTELHRRPNDWHGAKATVTSLASGWLCPSGLLEEVERCASTPGARLGCRSRVGEEFRTFAHGVCKDDKDMLHVLENKREVVYAAAWAAAMRQLGQRANAHTTRKFWTDGPARSVPAFFAHDKPIRVEPAMTWGTGAKSSPQCGRRSAR